jgi:hypothetical protein
MRSVRDSAGHELLLVERTDDGCLVRDPETGEERRLPADDVEPVGADPLELAARAVPATRRRVVRALGSDAALGLLADLEARGPLPVRECTRAYDRCESDLHGLFAELVAAGAVAETEIAGERAYCVTDEGQDALSRLR